MDSDDGCSIGTASTDTSMFLRELQALNLNSEGNTGPIAPPSITETLKVGLASGEEENPETLPQAMRTLRGEQPTQVVNFSESTEESSVGIYSRKVEVFVSPTSSFQEKAPGSNKIKITPMVNHVWDHKFYYGNLVAVHQDLDFLAYVLKGKSGGIVRVVSCRTAARNLLKCFNGNVMDIAFALSDDIYLAAADETGTLFVHSFMMDGDSILSQLILHVQRETYNIESAFRNHTRVIWCPYMPDEESDSSGNVDVAKMLVLLHGTQAEVWNVEYVSKEQGSEPLTSKNVSAGVMCIEPYEPLMPVVNAAFAPDGSAIAVAYFSGLVKFFLVDLDGEAETGCMHEWNPHDGQPVTSLFFLDDHRHTSPDQQLWKFALTGANFNTEIKIWSCETWACVQTLRFNTPQSQPDLCLQLKSDIDLSSKYLVLSDIQSRILYILHLHQDSSLATAHISSLSKFFLTQPCVSFAVYDACLKRLKRSADDSHLDEITTGELLQEDDVHENGDDLGTDMMGNATMGIQVKMYAVHTKSLQEYLIRYRPETSAPPPYTASISSVSQDEPEPGSLRDLLSDVSLEQSEVSNDMSNIPHDSSHPAHIPPQGFSSPGASATTGQDVNTTRESEENLLGEVSHVSNSSTSSFTQITAMNEDLIDSPLSSIDPSSVLSPSSVFSQTPQKPSMNHSDNPLPPISSCDDEEEGSSTPKNSVSGRSAKESPHQSMNSSNQSNQDVLDELFSNSWQQQQEQRSKQSAGDSMESTSSTGKQDDRYDENDQEVAQTFGSTLISEGFGGMQDEEEDDDDEEKEEQEEDEGGGKVVEMNMEEKRKEAKWPDPPDVSTEAKRLVTEAIQQGTQEEDTKNEAYDADEDDENDEAEIEEIVLQSQSDERDTRKFIDNSQMLQSLRLSKMESEKVMSNVENKLSDLTDKMLQQQDMLLAMQKELASQRDVQVQLHRQQIEQQQLQQVTSQQPSIQEDISKLEDILVSRMEHSLAQHMQKETQRLQDSLARSDQQRIARDRDLQAGLVQDLGRSVRDTVSHTLKTEVKQTVSPALHRFVEPMKDKIHQEVAQRLTACDSLLKDNISKAVKSRSTMDVLANSVGDVIYQQMQQAYNHTFKSSMLPSFSASMEKTVRDVHGIFQQGTKEYQLYLKQNADSMSKERSKVEDAVERMEAAEHQFAQSMSHMKNLVLTSVKEELSGQLACAMGSFKDSIVMEINGIVKEEIGKAMKDHGETIDDKLTSYLRSAAATPVPCSQNEEVSKEKIMRDLRGGHIDEAFQSALSAENLELVLYACEAVSPMNLFSVTPCPLSQPVILSLISQLATNLEQHFELKMRFLTDAVMSLDTDNSRTAEHIPSVLSSLVQYLHSALKTFNGDPKKIKEIKMLIMAANSLVASRM